LSVQLVFKISNLCAPDPAKLQTDTQTDRQTTCNLSTAICTTVHRAVKTTDENSPCGTRLGYCIGLLVCGVNYKLKLN